MSMKNETFGISIKLGIQGIKDIAKIDNSFKSLKKNILSSTGSLKGFSRELATIKAANKNIIKLKTDREGLKNELLQVGTLLRGGALIAPIKLAIDYESSLADVKKVVDFKGEDEFKNFSHDLQNLATKLPLSVNELAAITASGGQLGVAKENLLSFTTIAAKMGVAFDMSADEAGQSMANMMNIFKLSIDGVKDLGDTINHISNNSNARARDITKVIGKIAGNAKDFGLSKDAAAGLAGAFLSLGKPAEVAGTAINAMLNKLNNADKGGKKFSEALGQIGMEGNNLKQAILKNPQKALTMFLETLEKAPKAEKTGILTDLFGLEFADDISLLTGAMDSYRKSMGLANEKKAKSGSMDKEAEARAKTTANALTLLSNSVKNIAINIGSTFLPAITKAASGLSSFFGTLHHYTSLIPGLNSAISFAAAGFFLFKPAFLIFKIGKNYIKSTILELLNLSSALKIKLKLVKNLAKTTRIYTAVNLGLDKAFKMLKISSIAGAGALRVLKIALISTGIGAIVVGLGLAAAYLIQNWDKVKAFFSGFLQGMKTGLGGVIEPLRSVWDAFSSLFSAISSLFSGTKETKEGLESATNAGIRFGELVGVAIKGLFKPILWIIESLTSVVKLLSNISLEGIKEKIGSMWGGVKDFFGLKDKNVKVTKKTEESLIQKAYAPMRERQAVLANSNQSVNVNFSGDFALHGKDGKFDMQEFQDTVTKGVKKALHKDKINAKNRDIRG